MARIFIGIFLLSMGVSALVGISLLKYVAAAFLILLGLRIITGKRFGDINHYQQSTISEDSLNEVAIFSPLNLTIKSNNFTGGKILMIFAGGEIDLSRIKIPKEGGILELVTIFGGGKLIVPKDCRVNIQSTAIIGGYENKTESTSKGGQLTIKGVTIFGGFEIGN